jgi:hypothetical protein
MSPMTRSAVISDDERYRYDLERVWNPDLATVAFVMLNPSTANALVDDPTITRCLGFARAWGCGRLVVRNLFALRATDPRELKTADVDPVGVENDAWLRLLLAGGADLVIAAWGTHGSLYHRDVTVRRILSEHPNVKCLGTTRAGHPRHPLYLARSTKPSAYGWA